MTQALYRYTARSEEGQLVSGSMAAQSTREALAHLRSRGLVVTSLADMATSKGRVLAALQVGHARRSAIASCLRSLAVLVGSGIALRRAIAAAIEQSSDKHVTEALRAIAADLDGGASLSEAMQHRPREFSVQVRALAAAGEQGGSLDDALAQAATLLEREGELRKKIAAALAYPAFVLCAAAALVGFLVVVTLPSFEGMLTQLHAPLPLTTRVMLDLSDAMRRPTNWLGLILALTLVASAFIGLRGRTGVRRQIDAATLRVPLLGALQRCANVAYYCRTLGTLLHCGVVVTSAARTAATVVTSAVYRDRAITIAESLRTGMALSRLLAESSLFGAMTVQLVSAGEESGSLDSMLVLAAEYHEREAEHALSVIVAVAEPALICTLGAVVGTIVASIVVPLYSAIGNIR
jgi:type IV pilus assembly protein PilC